MPKIKKPMTVEGAITGAIETLSVIKNNPDTSRPLVLSLIDMALEDLRLGLKFHKRGK